MHARNFTTNVSKILDLKLSSEQIFSRKLSLGAPDESHIFKCIISLPLFFQNNRRKWLNNILLFLYFKKASMLQALLQYFS